MQSNTFLKKITHKGWLLDGTKIIKADVILDHSAEKKLARCPIEFVDFLTEFRSITNYEENTWFLSYYDYRSRPDETFPWNEFETQSLKNVAADSEEALKVFWYNHLPFVMSIKGGYSFIAICLDDEDYGKIYQGFEPEYEKVNLIAEDFEDFLGKLHDSLISI